MPGGGQDARVTYDGQDGRVTSVGQTRGTGAQVSRNLWKAQLATVRLASYIAGCSWLFVAAKAVGIVL